MKIENLANNQVIVQLNENNSLFSSYGTTIAKKENGVIILDEKNGITAKQQLNI